MKVTSFPTLDEALELHRTLIERFGGSDGVRDMGALESSLYRPQSGYYDTLCQQAAALIQSLARNHPFVDGNKRVAFAIGAIFLRMNDYRLDVDPTDGEDFIVNRIIVGHADIDEISVWLEERITKVS